jgi:hypothetical protein
MLWLILIMFFIVVSILLYIIIREAGAFCVMFFSIIPLILFFGLSFDGIWVYPSLVEDKAHVTAIQSEISSIRQAYYKESKDGSLVGGSLDNMKQSTVLSEYIKTYALKKADYNGRLSYVKTKMGKKVFWWLSNTAFISDDVLKLEEIK